MGGEVKEAWPMTTQVVESKRYYWEKTATVLSFFVGFKRYTEIFGPPTWIGSLMKKHHFSVEN